MRLFRLSGLILALTMGHLAGAGDTKGAVIVNGDFSAAIDLDGFTATGDNITEPTGDFAQLDTSGAFLRTLEQDFTVPTSPSTLSFDFAFSTDATTSGNFFVDSAAVSILTHDGDFLDILVVDLFGALPDPSDGIEFFTGATPIDVSFDSNVSIAGFSAFSGGTLFSGRITMELPSDVVGDQATIYFDLFDDVDGASSRAAFDNLSVTASAIPEPSSVIMWSLGALLGVVGTVRRRRQSGVSKPS